MCQIFHTNPLLKKFERNSGPRLPTNDGKLMCPRCGKRYGPTLNLVAHLQFECGKQTILQCPLCPRKCKRDDILQSHLRNIHRIIFVSNNQITRTQNDVVLIAVAIYSIFYFWAFAYIFYFLAFEYKCSQCHKTYKYKWNLLRHVRYECGKEPQFVCKICARAFTQKSSLKSLVGYVHGFALSTEYYKVCRY
nr:unnamed protein product [Callosobruchus chinensis]